MFNNENVFFDNLADPFSKRLEERQKSGWANGKKLNAAMNSLRVLKSNKVPLKKRIAYLQSLVSTPLPSEMVTYFGGIDITFAIGNTITVHQFERTSFALPSKRYYK